MSRLIRTLGWQLAIAAAMTKYQSEALSIPTVALSPRAVPKQMRHRKADISSPPFSPRRPRSRLSMAAPEPPFDASCTYEDRSTPQNPSRVRIVVLGSGWASVKFLQNIDTTKFDVTVVSPRNYFLFTPFLPSCVVGT
eukprot:CAMPEP_0113326114 /NCGR_PEP_ID=MMETSP0010_2-20120614/18281_1 /TAXON_ID=216773 ORGANISM="Corethron hystrix, Strain 308" /NCGR_SAMPLE_ID=MMETSP0010_2 /ASSEMBLY_ACC=CAM_ASM_000155 /LENGTH=137 /DNA_ID=CAMNT_0000186289 /DNA_START=15 /DNA_END=425 /DNA_ORIENTATION=+ /assembly_acc=CAM_ASM_000155